MNRICHGTNTSLLILIVSRAIRTISRAVRDFRVCERSAALTLRQAHEESRKGHESQDVRAQGGQKRSCSCDQTPGGSSDEHHTLSPDSESRQQGKLKSRNL